MAQNLIGLAQLQVDGVPYRAKGNFTYNLGMDMLTTVMGSDAPHGHQVTPQVAFIEGEITDDVDLDLEDLLTTRGATVSITLRNGKMIVLTDASYAGEGTGNTEEGNIGFRFESLKQGKVVKA